MYDESATTAAKVLDELTENRRFWNGKSGPIANGCVYFFGSFCAIDDAKIINPKYTFVNGDGRPGTYPISRLCPLPWDFSPRWCRASDCWSSGCKTTTSTSGRTYPLAAPSNPSRTPVSQWSRPAGKTVCNYENNVRFEAFIATISTGGNLRGRTDIRTERQKIVTPRWAPKALFESSFE